MGNRTDLLAFHRYTQDNNLGYSNSSTNETIDEWERSHPQYQPMHIGTGFATQTYRWTFTADYHYIDWSRNVSRDAQYKYENQHKLSIGTLYITQPRKPRSIELMGGASFSNSYISLRGGKTYYAEILVVRHRMAQATQLPLQPNARKPAEHSLESDVWRKNMEIQNKIINTSDKTDSHSVVCDRHHLQVFHAHSPTEYCYSQRRECIASV